MNIKSLPFFLFIGLLALSSCRKNVIDTDPSAKLEFSTDTLTFDTVFTTLGSTTLYFKVYNRNRNAVKTDVFLAGGDASDFRLNIDGSAGNRYDDLEVYGNDSTYVFVEVTVDPNGQNIPLVIHDSVIFLTNGNRQKVVLEAWGQDAYFYRDSLLCNTIWSNDKPHVIVNAAAVDSGCTLTINAGTRIYMGGNARLLVFPTAKIIVNGTKQGSVVFQGIRLEDFYDDLPGQWNGIFILRGSTGNEFNYAVIKNSNYGINLGSPIEQIDACDEIPLYFSGTDAPDAVIKNTIIQNSFFHALGGRLSIITAENCLLFNSGDNLISFGFGGIYNLTHCTIANYGSPAVNHQKQTFFISNLLNCDNSIFPAQLEVTVENCIIYGSLEEELEFGYEPSAPFRAVFNNCLLKTKRVSDDTLEFNDVILNEDPQFTDREKDDYTISETSPCRDAGKNTSVSTDLNGNQRIPPPDIGAYEYSP
ncbi:MAG TPA: choice-of-anchor Q domain-containing protein [Chitinophagales bacterium]|nr:choice-of-anchor Q domain-containing protein [Chitinophagales bacterium]